MPAPPKQADPVETAVAVVRGFTQDLRNRAAAGKKNLQISLNQAEGLAIHLDALLAAYQAQGDAITNLVATQGEELARIGVARETERAEILEMTGEKTIAEVIDMANVGNSLMERIHLLTKEPGPFHNWTPADDPAEIVFDLVNHYKDEATALKLNRDQYQQAYRHWSMIADQRLGAANRSLFRARQAEADAKRYRYLRDRDAGPTEHTPPGLFIGRVPENQILTGEDADNAIDAATRGASDDR